MIAISATATARRIVGACIALAALAGPATADGLPTGFVDASSIVPRLVLDIRYAGPDNFVGTRIDGYEAPKCFLTRKAAEALARVQADIAREKLGLKVYDCYRPERAVAHFVRWSRDATDLATKPDYYPDLDKSDLFRLGYIGARSGHSRGSTVDLTLVGEGGRELDMGGRFDFFGALSASTSPLITREQQANRDRLREAMQKRNFTPYSREWWHFTLANEPLPGRYFDFVVR